SSPGGPGHPRTGVLKKQNTQAGGEIAGNKAGKSTRRSLTFHNDGDTTRVGVLKRGSLLEDGKYALGQSKNPVDFLKSSGGGEQHQRHHPHGPLGGGAASNVTSSAGESIVHRGGGVASFHSVRSEHSEAASSVVPEMVRTFGNYNNFAAANKAGANMIYQDSPGGSVDDFDEPATYMQGSIPRVIPPGAGRYTGAAERTVTLEEIFRQQEESGCRTSQGTESAEAIAAGMLDIGAEIEDVDDAILGERDYEVLEHIRRQQVEDRIELKKNME
ncbi:unnamed protein product, partial [Amoebophrya sp. A25]